MTNSVAQRHPRAASCNEPPVYRLAEGSYAPPAFETRNGAMRIDAASIRARPVKRCIDIAGALFGIVLFGPLMALIAALVAMEGGKVVFSHQRLGRGGRRFRCHKFRTMAPDAQQRLAKLLAEDEEARAEWERDCKLTNDPRITRLGGFLRTTSLDELPQFFNVLKGEMSLVGPRPITDEEVARYGDRFALYARCKPGITGLWQVSGRNNISYRARVSLDAHYALHQSVMMDISILLRTFGIVFARTGAR